MHVVLPVLLLVLLAAVNPPTAVDESRLSNCLANGRSFLRGVNHAHIHQRGHGYGSDPSAEELSALRELGVNCIAIMPYGYQDGATADEVIGYPGNPGRSEFFRFVDSTMMDDDIRREITSARKNGMGVVVKPHIWSNDFWRGGREWHGTIRQDSMNHGRWWESYRRFIIHYAALAEEGGADEFCVGTELVLMSTRYPAEWRKLISEVRAIFKGRLSYAAHWDTEFSDITFWNDLDYIGITGYFPLDASDSATVSELVEAWIPHKNRIGTIARKFDRPVIFLEAGYRAMSAPHRRPWESEGREPDPDAQARAYEALFRALCNTTWWEGVFFWKTFTDPNLSYERREGRGYSFRGMPAEHVVARWFLRE